MRRLTAASTIPALLGTGAGGRVIVEKGLTTS